MKYLIYGAGTIGITYAWLLSQKNEVELLVRPKRLKELSDGINIRVKDLRKKSAQYECVRFRPNCVTEFSARYDGVLVCVNRCELKELLPLLAERQQLAGYFAFLQNNWDLEAEIGAYLPPAKTVAAFPSNVGGGRDESGVEVIVFEEPVRLGGGCQNGIDSLRENLGQVGIKVCYDRNIFDWLKVHYLQQSVTAGAVLEYGGFLSFAQDHRAVKKMVRAFREGIEVCRLRGVDTGRVFPANMFRLPLFLVAHIMQRMFLDGNTREMVNNHMKKGLPEWIAGYKEVLEAGSGMGLPMTAWKSYESFVDAWLAGDRPLPQKEGKQGRTGFPVS